MSEAQRKLARAQERQQASDMSPGIARGLRKHVATLEQEIAEIKRA